MPIPERAARAAACSLILFSLVAQGDELPSPLTMGALVTELRERNPELRARRLDAKAAAARPRAAGRLDDPMVSFEWWQQPINFSMVPLMVTLRQPLPWPGTLAARRGVAEREADSARDRVVETERRLEASAKNSFLDAVLAEKSIEVEQAESAILEAMVKVMQARFQSGKETLTGILSTQSELLLVDNERIDLERKRDDARARLNQLLDRPPSAALGPLLLEPSHPTLPPEAELAAEAARNRPEVHLAADALAQAEAKLHEAGTTGNPELAVWAAYMVNVHGTDTFTAGVSSTLPTFSRGKRHALVDAAQAEVLARRADLDAQERKAAADVHAALLGMEIAARHERLHKEKLIPLAELSLKSAEAAYQSGLIAFTPVLDAARMLRQHHLNHARYVVEYERRLADLELAVGRDLSPGGGR